MINPIENYFEFTVFKIECIECMVSATKYINIIFIINLIFAVYLQSRVVARQLYGCI